jgi:hypothetical protein
MINDTITLVTREGFWSSDTRTFRRDRVKEIYRREIDGGLTSQVCPRGDYVEVELDTGEIVRGREDPNWTMYASTGG